jgi:hypothetical protein
MFESFYFDRFGFSCEHEARSGYPIIGVGGSSKARLLKDLGSFPGRTERMGSSFYRTSTLPTNVYFGRTSILSKKLT